LDINKWHTEEQSKAPRRLVHSFMRRLNKFNTLFRMLIKKKNCGGGLERSLFITFWWQTYQGAGMAQNSGVSTWEEQIQNASNNGAFWRYYVYHNGNRAG
jgi:hypothetical protein